MIARQAKAKMLWWMLYRFGSLAAVTEFKFADVFAISRAKYSHEVEIKVSRADLMTELNCIDIVLGRTPQTKYLRKHFKHQNYLLAKFPTFTRPNYFSFAVPASLIDVALPHLEGTPYGLYKIDEKTNFVKRIRKADYLHKDKMPEKEILRLLRKVSTEIQSLREREAIS